MFIALLLGNLALAVLVAYFVTRVFSASVSSILRRIISEDISAAWARYIMFAMYVAGISSGVRVWDLERYITPLGDGRGHLPLQLNADRLVLEAYRTLIGTLQGISGVLLLFFVVALIAYAVIRVVESRKDKSA